MNTHPRLLALLGILGFLAAGIPLAFASPDQIVEPPQEIKEVAASIWSSPQAQVQVKSAPGGRQVSVSQGAVYVRAVAGPVQVQTEDGALAVHTGTVIVAADGERVNVKVLEGSAQLSSPYLEGSPNGLLAAGETAEGRLVGPEEQASLEALGMHETEVEPEGLGMHELDPQMESLAMAEFGSLMGTLGMHEAVAGAVLLPAAASTTALAAVGNALARSNPVDGVITPLSP